MSKKILVIVVCISLFFLTALLTIGVFSFSKNQDVSKIELSISYLALADFNFSQENWEVAIDNYDNVLKIDENNKQALLGYGKAALKNGHITPHYFQNVLAIEPKNKEANYYLGLISLDTPEIARRYFSLSGEYELEKKNKILALLDSWPVEFPSLLYKRLLIAQIDIAIDENNLAAGLLQSVVAERADYRDAWMLLGQAYYNTAKYEDALVCFKKAQALDGGNEDVRGLVEKAEIAASGVPSSQ